MYSNILNALPWTALMLLKIKLLPWHKGRPWMVVKQLFHQQGKFNENMLKIGLENVFYFFYIFSLEFTHEKFYKMNEKLLNKETVPLVINKRNNREQSQTLGEKLYYV